MTVTVTVTVTETATATATATKTVAVTACIHSEDKVIHNGCVTAPALAIMILRNLHVPSGSRAACVPVTVARTHAAALPRLCRPRLPL